MLTRGSAFSLSRIRVSLLFLLPPLAARDDMEAGQMRFPTKVEVLRSVEALRWSRFVQICERVACTVEMKWWLPTVLLDADWCRFMDSLSGCCHGSCSR